MPDRRVLWRAFLSHAGVDIADQARHGGPETWSELTCELAAQLTFTDRGSNTRARTGPSDIADVLLREVLSKMYSWEDDPNLGRVYRLRADDA